MARYIDAEMALKIIDSYAKTVSADGKVVVDAIRDIVGIITPTADVVPKVAREIIKDLVDFVDKKERQKMIFGKSVWYVESDDLTDFIAELKKKYTEGL